MVTHPTNQTNEMDNGKNIKEVLHKREILQKILLFLTKNLYFYRRKKKECLFREFLQKEKFTIHF